MQLDNVDLGAHFVPFQVFLRDPDGYFVKFCTCDEMEDTMNSLSLTEKVPIRKIDGQSNEDDGEGEEDIRGIRKFWKKVRH